MPQERWLRWTALAVLLANLPWNSRHLALWALLAYSIYSLRERQRPVIAHDRIAVPLTAFGLMAIAWTLSERVALPTLHGVLTFLLLGVAISMFRHALLLHPRVGAVPISLALGWISVETLKMAPDFLMVLALGGLGLWLNRRFASLVYPLVMAWGAFALALERRHDDLTIHVAAMAVGTLLVAWVAVAAVTPRRRVTMRWRATA